jgi:hypothetical protein
MALPADARSRDSYFSGQNASKAGSGGGYVDTTGGSTSAAAQDLLSPSDSASRAESATGFGGLESTAAVTASTDSKRGRPVAPVRPTFRQERDAGRVPEAEVIPPEYNPEWADHQTGPSHDRQ